MPGWQAGSAIAFSHGEKVAVFLQAIQGQALLELIRENVLVAGDDRHRFEKLVEI